VRVIAGSSGNRRAAPILLEMLRREQFFDGGKATGIVTTPRVIRDSQYSVGIKNQKNIKILKNLIKVIS